MTLLLIFIDFELFGVLHLLFVCLIYVYAVGTRICTILTLHISVRLFFFFFFCLVLGVLPFAFFSYNLLSMLCILLCKAFQGA